MADSDETPKAEGGVMATAKPEVRENISSPGLPPSMAPPIGPPISNLYNKIPGRAMPNSGSLDPTAASIRQNVNKIIQLRQGIPGINPPGQGSGMRQENVGIARPRGAPPISPSHMVAMNTSPAGNTISQPPPVGNMRGPPGRAFGMGPGPGPPGTIFRGPPPRGPPPRGPPPNIPPRFSTTTGSSMNQIRNSPAVYVPPQMLGPQMPLREQNSPVSPPVSRKTTYVEKTDYKNDEYDGRNQSSPTKQKYLGAKRPLNYGQEGYPTDDPHLSQPIMTNSYTPPQAKIPIPPFGKLRIKIVGGKNLRAGQGVLGNANPFVIIKVGNKVFSTSVHRDGGKNPVWNNQFEFDITNEKELTVDVLDKGKVGRDTFMGKATVNLLDWMAEGKFDGTVEILDQSGGLAGGLIVEVAFHKTDQPSTYPDFGIEEQNTEQEFTDQQILDAFRTFDLDKNNYVGAAELRHILTNIGETVRDEEVDEMIKMVDKDGDGQVCFEEFYKMVTGGKKPPIGLGRRRNTERISNAQGAMKPNMNRRDSLAIAQAAAQARNFKRKVLDEFARKQNLKPESIKVAHKRYMSMDKNKTGMIDYIEFCDILQVDPSPQCETVFSHFDYLKTGMADAKEILIALANFTGAGKDDKLKFAFLVFDEQNKGVITKKELIKILKANHMAKSDAEVYRKAETIMVQADKNGDGIMSFNDFMSVSKKFPNILFPSFTS